MAEYMVSLIGHVIEALRPENFPRSVKHDFIVQADSHQQLNLGINEESGRLLYQQKMFHCPERPDEDDQSSEAGYGYSDDHSCAYDLVYRDEDATAGDECPEGRSTGSQWVRGNEGESNTMILLSLDFETTGLNPAKEEVTEVGAVLWSTINNRAMETASYFVKVSRPISEEITRLTGISQIMIDKFGYEQQDAFDKLQEMIQQADAYVGQNVVRFDKRFYEQWAKRMGTVPIEKLWIDTRTDLPGVESKHLGYMAADAGFLNPFPHNAVSDCLTVLRLVSMHPIDKVVERAKSPVVIFKQMSPLRRMHWRKQRKYAWAPAIKCGGRL